MRLALVYFAVRMALWLFVQHHNALPFREFQLFIEALAKALFTSGFLAMLYLALEPLVRRRWPHRIISWNRLLAGDYSDPLVGRDIMIGATFGAGMILCTMMTSLVQRWVGQPPLLNLNPAGTLMGAHLFVSRFASQLTAAFFITFITTLLLWLFVSILRKERIALVALWLLLTVIQSLLSGASLVTVPFTGLVAAMSLFVLYRFGLLALMLAVFIMHLWVFLPMTTELTAWYALDFTIALGIALALVLYGFYRSLAGQPLLSGKLLREDSY